MLTIALDKPSYSPGDTIRATITLRLNKPVRARALVAKLICSEKGQHKAGFSRDLERELGRPYSSRRETGSEVRAKNWFSQEKKVEAGGEYSSGDFPVEFTLPKNAPPSSHDFGHGEFMHAWKLSAKLDIPLALDENGDIEVIVGNP